VFLKDRVIVKSEGGSAVTLIDMQHAPGPQPQVVFGRDLSSAQTTLQGFTITGAPVAGGAGAYVLGTLTLRDCVFRDLDAGGSTGGGLAADGNAILIGCEFVNCVGSGGGAIAHSNGRIEMYDCYVHECGSIAVLLSGSAEPPVESSFIEGCTFENCWDHALSITEHLGGTTVVGCRFINNQGGAAWGALGMGGVGPKVVRDCLFWNNRASGGNGEGGGLSIESPATVQGNTFYANDCVVSAGGAAVAFGGGSGTSYLLDNVIAGCPTRGAVMAYHVSLVSGCNVFWANPGGLGRYYTPGPTDRIVDPLFCDVPGGDFRVAVGSPCIPPGSLDCGQIGAFGEGCGVIAVEPQSWGEIKAAYRGQDRSKP
jgi:hypothetical protein